MSEISRKLMRLACFFDEHLELDEFPEFFTGLDHFREHLFGDKAARLDVFAARFGVEVEHRDADTRGVRYSTVAATLGAHTFGLQCRTEDYEAATGTKIPESAAAREARLLAEVKYFSDNPIPDDSAVTS
ncbi:hypothetical protein DMH01_03490 [Amycolatopsis sp. WAC 04182]|uniref:hypothetical protein n=1 Tax=Amycolatopsis sp. WAC 04182 TaxID=2203198 RepID=UPI000F770738|nr:hypothetical protein [Amycolatopsis sp. WAC 04182]RSN65453.1 hypothetical protein DMH01_03490 [Amycolatopsis sp. WAC 04182]